jgi:queuine tRNA-ribosyltransferase
MSMIRENPRYGTISQRGIHFVDLDGSRERTLFTPERSIRLQFDLGADLMICLDDCPSPAATRPEVEAAVARTIQWAGRCRAEFDRLLASRGKKDDRPRPLLLGVIQGGYDPELRRRCAEGLRPLGLDGYGFGGWPLTPAGELAADMLALTAELVPDALRFALGTGSPEHIVACYRMGWRIFDCVLPTRDARHQRLYVWNAERLDQVDLGSPGFYRFVYAGDKKHTRHKGPISLACDCPCCQDYTLGYLHHLFDIGDALALRLATLHNLRFYTQLLERLGR